MLRALLLAVAAALTVPIPARKTPVSDVCVLGGGSAGTYLAYRAAQRGRRVAVIEPKRRLGGHCMTYRDPSGFRFQIAVKILAGDDTDLIKREYARFGVPLVDYSDLPIDALVTREYDFSTGQRVDLPHPSPEVVAGAIQRYLAVFYGKYAFLETQKMHPDFTSDSVDVDELLSPFPDFIAKYNLRPLQFAFFNALQQGLGDPTVLPTYYALYTLTPRLLPVLFPGLTPADVRLKDSFYVPLGGGCGRVYAGVGRVIGRKGGSVYLNAEIRKVNRLKHKRPNGVRSRVRFYHDGKLRRLSCRSVVVAFPQRVPLLKPILKLTRPERRVFGQMDSFNSYIATVWRAQGAQLDPTSGVPPKPIRAVDVKLVSADPLVVTNPSLPSLHFLVVENVVQCNASGFESYYAPLLSLNGSFTGTRREAVKLIYGDLKRLEQDLSDVSLTPIRFERTPRFYDTHMYDLRPGNVTAVREGIYNELYELQGGKGGVFYTGALFARNNQLKVWQYSDLVLEQSILPSLDK